MKNKKKSNEKHKSHFGWAVVGILTVLFIMFFINGYLVYKQTGIDDEDISVIN